MIKLTPEMWALARVIDPDAYWDEDEPNRNHRRRNMRALMAASRALEWVRARQSNL